MQQVDAVDARRSSWETVASYVLTVCQERDKASTYSYLQVAADLVEPTKRLIADMNGDDSFTIVAEGDDFPGSSPAPRSLSPAHRPGALSMATGAILKALGIRR
ncbi:MAG: hypothetical protein KJ947_21665 [Alphaproteobacteria bacterium]|nr:hypothetical protein [Alphaproteobacteria bacterium]MBU1552155.1 hypothetical protein [Alphaproteobacteria bacterium]MBU2336935.1 hypothetical protein [Alphaproteobacteria bacterium]MBU2389692.1 hypothetical protein [Alphaproteobacteria bacterium]